MKYRSGYKYQLADDERCQVSIRSLQEIDTEFISLTRTGLLTVKRGYAWDGPSGPTIDTKSSMRGSLIHDALYQLIREGHLPAWDRNRADDELYRLCVEDGMWKWRAALWRREVRKFAAGAASPKHIKQVLIAP